MVFIKHRAKFTRVPFSNEFSIFYFSPKVPPVFQCHLVVAILHHGYIYMQPRSWISKYLPHCWFQFPITTVKISSGENRSFCKSSLGRRAPAALPPEWYPLVGRSPANRPVSPCCSRRLHAQPVASDPEASRALSKD